MSEQSYKNEENITIDKLKLLDLNPRYTNFKEINWENLYKNGNRDNQDQIALKLLAYEGDYSDFIVLLESIYENGYNNSQDRLLLMKTINSEYLVLEGNRRVLAFKMIINIKWAETLLAKSIDPKKDEIISDFETSDENNNLEGDEELNSNLLNNKVRKLQSKNYSTKKLYNTIREIKDDSSYITKTDELKKTIIDNITFYKDFNNEKNIELLNKAIFGRSVNAPGGKRPWSRYQTLSNTWSFYKEHYNYIKNNEANNKSEKDIIDKAVTKTAKTLFKSTSSVRQEIISAKRVFILINNSEYNIINWKKEKISAIELSLHQIDISHIVEEKNFFDFFKIKENLNPMLEFDYIDTKGEDKDYFIKKFSNFLIGSYFDKLYSTRGWKNNKSQKKLYDFFGQKYNPQSIFQNILNSDDLEEKEAVEKIKNIAIEINNFYKTFIEKKVRDVELSSSYKHEPSFVIRNYIEHALSQDINKLLINFNNQTFTSYPYYSIVAIARNFIELSLIYCFSIDEPFRKKIVNYYHENKSQKNDLINGIENIRKILWISSTPKEDFTLISNDRLAEIIFVNSIDETNENFDKKWNVKIKWLFDIIINSEEEKYYFFNKEDKNKIFDQFSDVFEFLLAPKKIWNNFNRTIHTPYWLLDEKNYKKIPELMKESVEIVKKIVNNFTISLNWDAIEILQDLDEKEFVHLN